MTGNRQQRQVFVLPRERIRMLGAPVLWEELKAKGALEDSAAWQTG